MVAKAIMSEKATVMSSNAIPQDEFTSFYQAGNVIEPLYEPELLIRLPEQSDILGQCIDAYKTNIVGFGPDFKYDIDYDKLAGDKKKALDTVWATYENFFKYCNLDVNFTEVMKRVLDDRERIGWGVIEVINDVAGVPAGLEHIPAQKVRMCRRDETALTIPVEIQDETGNPITITVAKRFRKFVQIVSGKKVYFKEFGDPRAMSKTDGTYVGENEAIAPENQATSLIFLNIYCPYTEYGLPRYLGQLLNIYGNRKAEELNYQYFTDGRHIPLAIVVENGQLTEGSKRALEGSKGNAAAYKFLLLEAKGIEKETSLAGDDTRSPVSIKIEQIAQMLEHDGLFQEYCKNNRDKIRSSFRLHPIYTGESQDYTRATADTARTITEEQVFQPERDDLAFRFNSLLKPALGIQNISMTFKAPKISDNAAIAAAIAPYVSAGAATPNMLIDTLGELLGKQFEAFEGEWGNTPLSITLRLLDLQRMDQRQQQTSGAATGSTGAAQPLEKSDSTSEILSGLHALRQAVREAIQEDGESNDKATRGTVGAGRGST